eukprot:TRINITY_DN3532_c0_g1_i1.p1 TRINITY_DN3532_c0_g1~~TRINITY_DN3532_c0_g1_i1.p1  ORF type:complete len:638 (-),score=107.10 TRINITY_DN3532_c0_g1_i1:697-2610(-)
MSKGVAFQISRDDDEELSEILVTKMALDNPDGIRLYLNKVENTHGEKLVFQGMRDGDDYEAKMLETEKSAWLLHCLLLQNDYPDYQSKFGQGAYSSSAILQDVMEKSPIILFLFKIVTWIQEVSPVPAIIAQADLVHMCANLLANPLPTSGPNQNNQREEFFYGMMQSLRKGKKYFESFYGMSGNAQNPAGAILKALFGNRLTAHQSLFHSSIISDEENRFPLPCPRLTRLSQESNHTSRDHGAYDNSPNEKAFLSLLTGDYEGCKDWACNWMDQLWLFTVCQLQKNLDQLMSKAGVTNFEQSIQVVNHLSPMSFFNKFEIHLQQLKRNYSVGKEFEIFASILKNNPDKTDLWFQYSKDCSAKSAFNPFARFFCHYSYLSQKETNSIQQNPLILDWVHYLAENNYMNNIFGLLQVCYRPGDLEKQYVSYLLKAAEQKSDPQQQHIIVDQVELIRCLDEQATENILVQYLHAIADRWENFGFDSLACALRVGREYLDAADAQKFAEYLDYTFVDNSIAVSDQNVSPTLQRKALDWWSFGRLRAPQQLTQSPTSNFADLYSRVSRLKRTTMSEPDVGDITRALVDLIASVLNPHKAELSDDRTLRCFVRIFYWCVTELAEISKVAKTTGIKMNGGDVSF